MVDSSVSRDCLSLAVSVFNSQASNDKRYEYWQGASVGLAIAFGFAAIIAIVFICLFKGLVQPRSAAAAQISKPPPATAAAGSGATAPVMHANPMPKKDPDAKDQ